MHSYSEKNKYVWCSQYLSTWITFVHLLIFTARKRSLGKVMFLHMSVILFTGGMCIPACTGYGVSASGSRGCTPLGRHPQADHPGQPPPDRHPLEMTTEGGGMHPNGMHSCYCNGSEKYLALFFRCSWDRSNPQVNKNPSTGFPSHTFIYSNYDVA